LVFHEDGEQPHSDDGVRLTRMTDACWQSLTGAAALLDVPLHDPARRRSSVHVTCFTTMDGAIRAYRERLSENVSVRTMPYVLDLDAPSKETAVRRIAHSVQLLAG